MEVLLKMARIMVYPSQIVNVNGNTGIYREMEEKEYLTNGNATYGHWGNEDPGPNYRNAVSSINGGRYKPSQIKGSTLANIRNKLPANARITGLAVEWAYAKFSYPNMGHGSFGQPIISIPELGLHAPGNAPPKDSITTYNVGWYNLKGIYAEDLYDASITFDLPMNTAANPAYIKMQFLRIYIDYVTPNYVPQVDLEPNLIEYGRESEVRIDVTETNNAKSTDTVPVVLTIPSGLSIVPGSINAQGTWNQSNSTWYAKTSSGKARLTFKVTPSAASVSGNKKFAAKIVYDGVTHTSENTLYISPQRAKLLECSVSENAIKQSVNSRHYTLFTLTVQNNARTPLDIYLDFDTLKINGSLPGYNASTKTLTITEWDGNNVFDVQLQLYANTLSDAQIICYSNAWTGVTKVKVNVNEEFDYEEFYTELDAPLFTLENMYKTHGQQYVFGCLCRVTGVSSIIRGMKNVRASVINNGEKFTPKVSQIGDWQFLYVKFTYDETKKLSFRFYGNYIEEDRGKVEFGNLFVIHADYFKGYEYPALAFDDLNKLITNDDYTNLLLEPPEKNPSSRHYFDLMDFMGLEENEYLIPHGLEVTGDISSEEKVNLSIGFGHTGIDELDYYTTSINVNDSTENFKIGGKFETLGLSFNEIVDVLKDIQFYMQVDDVFDNQTPVNVQMKNVRVTLYYSLNNDCWEFFVNGVSSKFYLLDLMVDSEIPRGANYDVNKFKVDGADGEYPNRINLEENEIKLKFTTCECATIDELTYLIEHIVEWLYPERDTLDNPQLKTISFFYAPDRGYDYYIDESMDAEAVDGAYECEVKLIVPSGLARSLDETESAAVGMIGHMGKVKPTIFFTILSHDGDIILVESDSGQKFTIQGQFIDNLPINTELKLDCKNRKLYYEAYGEWFLIDPNCISIDSDFFILKKHFDFSASVNCRVSEVKYYELRG